jgi:hypothetical protein
MRGGSSAVYALTVRTVVATLQKIARDEPMPKISLRRLLSKLTVLALTTSVATPAAFAAAPCAVTDDDSELDADLTIDREHLDPRDAALTLGRSLALALGEIRPLAATHLAATWALSADPVRRLSLAYALEWTDTGKPLVGAALVIEHLAADPDPSIRSAAARAAWARRTTGGDAGVLARLSADPDPDVRAIALRALR